MYRDEGYKQIIHRYCPEVYKLKQYNPGSLTSIQIFACLKNFINEDTQKCVGDGWIPVNNIISLIKDLEFKASTEEIKLMLKQQNPEEFEKFDDHEKVSFTMFIKLVDTLKKEKLILVELGNSLNYIIFVLLIGLIMIYIGLFYDYN